PGGSYRRPVAQVQMYSHAEARELLRGLHAVREGATVGQQRGAGHNSMATSLCNAAVYAGPPAQIGRIHHQNPHAVLTLGLKMNLRNCTWLPFCLSVCTAIQLPSPSLSYH